MSVVKDNKDTNTFESSQTISEGLDHFFSPESIAAYNSPEAVAERKKAKEEMAKLADDIISSTTKCEISELENNLLLSCLRTNVSLYKDYADTIKEYPEYQKYLQFHHYK